MKIKYFKMPKHLVDPFALRLFYLQIQINVVKGNYPCTDKMAIRLAALQVPSLSPPPPKHFPPIINSPSPQHFLADANTKWGLFTRKTQTWLHRYFPLSLLLSPALTRNLLATIGKEHIEEFLPPSVVKENKVVELEERIFRIHAKHRGLRTEFAMREYLTVARQLCGFSLFITLLLSRNVFVYFVVGSIRPTFGVNLFSLFEGNTKGGRPVVLGTAEDGILYSTSGKTVRTLPLYL